MPKYYFKVYLKNNNSSTKDIRRFELGDEYRPYTANFKSLCQKLTHYFPELRDKDFIVSWMDEEKDLIRISSDEELKTAIQDISGEASGLCKLFVQLPLPRQEAPSSNKNKDLIHYGVVCDGCDADISGFRYKCIQCEDYDLCSQCETLGLHSDHCMIRMPRPLQWSSHYGKRLLHHMRKFLKKNGINLSKEDIPDECPMKRKKCHEFSTANINVFPWLEAFTPFFNAFNERKTESDASNAAGSSKNVPEEEDKKDPKINISSFFSTEDITQLLRSFGADTDIPNNSNNPSQNDKAEQKKEHKDEDTSNKFPGEGQKLVEKTQDTASGSDAASVTNQDTPVKKTTETDEWTIVDKSEASDISHASSVSLSLNEIPENQVSSTVPSAPAATTFSNSSNQTIYPQLPKEEKIYHPNPKIQRALETMIAMGFSNKGGLLTYLLQAENGNINKVLDLLQPADK